MAYILGGLDNSSKSYSSMQWAIGLQEEKPSIFLDLEYPRAKNLHDTHFPDGNVDIRNCKVLFPETTALHRRGQRDSIKSFELFENNLIEVLNNFEKYGIIVIDGISDIRSDYSEVWLSEYNKANPDKKRKAVGKDISAWTAINKHVIEMTISPLQELGEAFNTTVIFTSKMHDDYKLIKTESGKEDSIKTGKKSIDIHQDIRHIVNTICLLESDGNGKYYVSIQKSIRGATERKEMTKPLWEILLEAGV